MITKFKEFVNENENEDVLQKKLDEVLKAYLLSKGIVFEKDFKKEFYKLADTDNLIKAFQRVSKPSNVKLSFEEFEDFLIDFGNGLKYDKENSWIVSCNSVIGTYEKDLRYAISSNKESKPFKMPLTSSEKEALNKPKTSIESGYTKDSLKEFENLKTTLKIYNHLIKEQPKGYKTLLSQNVKNLFTFYSRYCLSANLPNPYKDEAELIKNVNNLKYL